MISASLQARLDELVSRHEDLAEELAQPDVASDLERYKRLAQEYAQLEALVTSYASLRHVQAEQHNLQAMAADEDAEVRQLAEDELADLPRRLDSAQAELRRLLVPRDPQDGNNVFVEIRAGTGGDEAALFAGDLLRMYTRYAEARQWQIDILNASEGEAGGYKEVILCIQGEDVYSRMKFESGGHRVQRVPVTESQGRIHTSAATVAVLPELDEVEVDINPAELRIDTFRASGAGGQHVNKTDSAIRITHLPTGVVVECQQERSQHKNRARAMSLLAARLQESEVEKQRSERAAERKSLVGSGDRSQRIRTYNFPQNRMTDHRINLTLYSLEDIMQGALDQVIDPLRVQHQADALAAMGVE